MAPGAITAATIAQGTRSRYAGPLISLGHGIVEIPLIFLLMLGLSTILQTHYARVAIGLTGGAFLIWMAVGMLREIKKPDYNPKTSYTAHPVTTGLILSATNPYFLFWWATVGLGLALDAKGFGMLALVLFAVVHWLCDLVWLTILSFASFHGTTIMSPRNVKYILGFCSLALIYFGAKFVIGAAMLLFQS